mmetsp:Transcript_1532/g.2161  ORF Transcript_1532/g.2161 Transcript_1532/m.2161 type:complete len:330 (-) Transcript_1532:119-1108(-)|eukprot:CAMPEP_0198145590 /NCGR_PEP_ID=MMETSP1443-20131203/24457_1 /TAXON_ID=186043 /ORGANISM="Entomoneis sp., Strain CCMP2396" /LENGTH=329 /DNA_ID=CAMNT_0043809281 /DNA_START=333 /DNA_END=1322 /DNA_ORIENTATION=-
MLQVSKFSLQIDQSCKNYASTASGFLNLLSEVRDDIKKISLDRDFIRSLNLDDKFLILEEIGELPHLREVSLTGGDLPIEGLSALFQSARGLKTVRISNADIRGSVNAFQEMEGSIGGHPRLQEFSLVNFEVIDEEGKILYKKLDGLIAQLCTVRELSVLRLEASDSERVTFEGTSMAPLFASTQLHELHLSHFCLSKMHLRMLSWALRQAPLRKLSVKYAHLDDQDISKLSKNLGSCQHLQELDVSGNIFGNPGCIALSEGIATSKTLSTLSLLDNRKVGKDGYAALSDMLSRNNVVCALNIPGNKYNRVILKRLESNSKMTKAALAA